MMAEELCEREQTEFSGQVRLSSARIGKQQHIKKGSLYSLRGLKLLLSRRTVIGAAKQLAIAGHNLSFLQ